MKTLKLNWYKITPTKLYLTIPNQLITDIAVNPNALALLLLIISNKEEHFTSKKDVYKALGWNINSKSFWKNSVSFLKEKGYLSVENGNYIFSNTPKFIKKVEVQKDTEKKINYIVDDSRVEIVKVQDFLNTFNQEKEKELPF